MSTMVTVVPWRVAKKVVQPDGQAVSVSRRVVIAVTVTAFDEAVISELMLAAAGVVKVVHDEEVEVVLGLLVEDNALLETSEGAGSSADEAFEDGKGAGGSIVGFASCDDADVVDAVLLGVSMTVTETVVGFAGFAFEGAVTVSTMVVGATAAGEV